MAGGLLNIISEGNNNIILTGNPTKTFFRVTYSKYTNFGMQKFRIDYDGQRDLRLSEPSVFSFKIPRYAELLMDTYIVVTLPHIWSPIYHPCESTSNKWAPYDFRWINNLGTNMIKEIEIKCGNFTLQKYSGEYLAAVVERDFNATKKTAFNEMTGNVDVLNNPANAFKRANCYPSAFYSGESVGEEPSIRGRTLYIPINTWFTLDSRCAFPLVALQYNELHINVTMRPIEELFQVRDVFDYTNLFPYVRPDFTKPQFPIYRYLQTPPSDDISPINYPTKMTGWNADIHILANYCFLSKEEILTFTGEDQIYLIKDVTEYNYENVTGTKKVKLQTTGMVANWMWYLQRNDVFMRNEWSNYTNWPYRNIPQNITSASQFPAPNSTLGIGKGPLLNPDESNTGIFVSGIFNVENQKEILETMGILFNGEYRENVLTREVFDYVEKYTRTAGFTNNGLYCYNFCLNTDPHEYQPSGAVNMSKFKSIELEMSTYVPQIDTVNSNYQVQCNADGSVIINAASWRLYEYNFNMKLFEERYNVLSFIGGYCGLLYAK
jgi:hypothetical protein